jgi:hypothetical protein
MNIEQVRDLFMWCSIINVAILLFSSSLCIFARGWMYQIHSKIFNISRETFEVMIYSFVGAWKILVILFNVVPWIALLILTC